MSEIESLRPLAAVAISAVAIPLILASYRRPNVREGWSVAAALGKFAIVASMLPGVLGGDQYVWSAGAYAPTGAGGPAVEFALRADALGMVFALLASLLWVFTAFYAAGYMRGLGEHGQTRFFASFAASLSAALGIAFASNLVTIFVFYELLSVATYPLVAHDETDEARAAGRKYLLYTFFGGGVMVLGGTLLVFFLADTTTFGETASELAADPALARAAFAMLATGFGVKAGLMPLHSWLPDAMVAPTPVSGLLHAVAVVKSGVFGIARLVLHVYDPQLIGDLGVGLPLAVVAAVTLLAASVIALRQDRLKRRLAYSTVSQLSYIVLGLAMLGPATVAGADPTNLLRGGLLHIPAHAFMKLVLFFCAGIIHVETHTDYISEMDGIGKRMPLTMAAFAVAAAGMAGIPLVAGFVSKWFLLIGAVEAEQAIFAVALLVSGVLNIGYFWPIVYGAFFESHDDADEKPLVGGPLGGRFGVRAIQLVKPADAHHGGGAGSTASDIQTGAFDSTTDDTVDATPNEAVDATGDDHGQLAVDRNPSDHLPESEQSAQDATGDASREDAARDGVPHGADADDASTVDSAGREQVHPDYHDHVDHEGEHGGPGPGGWERVGWTGAESTWLMLGPILAIATGAVVLGVVPYEAVFLDLIETVAEEVVA